MKTKAVYLGICLLALVTVSYGDPVRVHPTRPDPNEENAPKLPELQKEYERIEFLGIAWSREGSLNAAMSIPDSLLLTYKVLGAYSNEVQGPFGETFWICTLIIEIKKDTKDNKVPPVAF